MRTNNTFLFFICLLSQVIFGQVAGEIKIRGIIDTDSTSVEGVNIINLTTDQSTSSNYEGVFYLLVKEGDLLAFSAVNLVTLRKRLTKADIIKNDIAIKMQPNSIPLKEVVVNADSQINAENSGIVPYNQKKYTAAERKLYTARSGLLDRPLNWMSGRTAMLKKEVVVENKQRLMNRLEYLFGDRYYVETLKIPEDYIKGFQYYCIDDIDFVAALNAKNKTLSMFLIIILAEKYTKIIANEN
ncbi:hypothetical protein [Flavobacterium frigoris]|uniref:CarboxypepD_reg-like domain-containing protein n=1 Tax=Flavobacterium frigoris (strain PS1) TaxID=1086011 RepID=H7FQT5_FLAFP|nr:hypothetical protein [Flavobacterium frigoris]EIA09072.1 hypothetical protein HJ01_01458 [Flavobacterium frigoris PS1]